MKSLKTTDAQNENPDSSEADSGASTGNGGGTHFWTWIVLTLIGLIFGICGGASGGFFGFVFGGLLWLSLCLAFSAIFKKTAWLHGASRAVVGVLAAVVLVCGSGAAAIAAPSSNTSTVSRSSSAAATHHSKTHHKIKYVSTSPSASHSPSPVVEVKQESTTQAVPFTTQDVNDASLTQGTTATRVAGQNGVRTITYNVTYTDGQETSRTEVSNTITQQPVSQVIAHGTRVVQQAPAQTCSNGTYVNSAGNTVCRPEQSSTVPSGATAKCSDGTYSYSQSRRGTCSSHGGVAAWL